MYNVLLGLFFVLLPNTNAVHHTESTSESASQQAAPPKPCGMCKEVLTNRHQHIRMSVNVGN